MNLTPKEKAKELVEKMAIYHWTTDVCDYEGAKQCALIAIEFAKENPLNTDGYNKYLQQVKTEILNQTTK
jgi:hypothetical protein